MRFFWNIAREVAIIAFLAFAAWTIIIGPAKSATWTVDYWCNSMAQTGGTLAGHGVCGR